MSYELALISDADFVQADDLGNKEIILFGSKSMDSYVKLSEKSIDYARFIIEMMRKEAPKEVIACEMKEKYPELRIDLDSFISKLADAGLIVGSKKIFDDEMELVGITIFQKKFSLIEKANLPISIIAIVYHVFSKALIWIPLLLFVSFLIIGLKGFDFVLTQHSGFDHYIFNGIALVVMTVLCFILHECGHAVAAIGNGVKLKDFSLGVYLGIIPTFYFRYYNLKTAPSLTKLKIVTAGVYSNLLLALLSFIVSCLVNPPLSGLLFEFSTLNILMILGNAMPMRLSDGYYAISLIIGKFDIRISLWRNILGLGNGARLPLPMLLYFLAMFGAIVFSIGSLIYRAYLLIDRGDYVFGCGLLVILSVMSVAAVLNIARKRRPE